MANQCPVCQHKFSAREALCHDWQDSNRSFGCPQCQTFFVKEMNVDFSEATKTAIVAGGITVPSMWIVSHGYFTDQLQLMIYGGAILCSVLILSIYPSLPWGKKLIQSSYKPEKNRENTT